MGGDTPLDIVLRLRERPNGSLSCQERLEAADEIEKLRKRLSKAILDLQFYKEFAEASPQIFAHAGPEIDKAIKRAEGKP